MAYTSVTGLLLAVLGLLAGRRAAGSRLYSAQGLAVALAAIGFGLALGLYDPLYFVLYKLVPGFDLFRAPARWLSLYVAGLAILAGYGVDGWFIHRREPAADSVVRRRG